MIRRRCAPADSPDRSGQYHVELLRPAFWKKGETGFFKAAHLQFIQYFSLLAIILSILFSTVI